MTLRHAPAARLLGPLPRPSGSLVSHVGSHRQSRGEELEVCAKSLSHVRLFGTPWAVARQAPLSVGFSREEYWSGLPCPPPGDLPDPGIEPVCLNVSCIGRRGLRPPGKPEQLGVDPVIGHIQESLGIELLDHRKGAFNGYCWRFRGALPPAAEKQVCDSISPLWPLWLGGCQSKAVRPPPIRSGHHGFAQRGGGSRQEGACDLSVGRVWSGWGLWGLGPLGQLTPEEKEKPSCAWTRRGTG